MSVTINSNNLTKKQIDYLLNTYNVYPEASTFNAEPDPLTMMECDPDDEDKISIPFGEWKKFHTDFPINPKWKLLDDPTSTITLYPEQVSIVEEALVKIHRQHYTFLHLPTATGKTVLSTLLMTKLGYRVLVSTTFTDIHQQWIDTIHKITNLKAAIVDPNKSKHKKWDREADVLVCTPYHAHNTIPDEIRKSIGLVIIDEAHKIVTKTHIKFIFDYKPKYVISCTATHDRADGMERALFLITGPREDFVWREKKKEFTVVRYETDIAPKYSMIPRGGKSTLDYDAFKKSLYLNPKRHQLVIDLIKNPMNNGIKWIIYSAFTQELNPIYDLLVENDIPTERQYDKYKRKKDVHHVALLGNYTSIGTGFDDSTYTGLMFLTSYKDVRQYEGRLRKDGGIIFDFVDKAPLLAGHFDKYRKPWYIQRGATVISMKRGTNKKLGSDDVEEIMRIKRNSKNDN